MATNPNRPTGPTGAEGAGQPQPTADRTTSETDRSGATGYHDSISGQPVDADGNFLNEPGRKVQDRSHIVADNWPELQTDSERGTQPEARRTL